MINQINLKKFKSDKEQSYANKTNINCCSYYCTSLPKQNFNNCTSIDNLYKEKNLNMSEVLNLYKNFIKTLISQIPDTKTDVISFNLNIELTRYEIQK